MARQLMSAVKTERKKKQTFLQNQKHSWAESFFLLCAALLLQSISVMSCHVKIKRLKTFQLVHPFLVFAANYQFQCPLFLKPIFSALTAARQWWKSPGLDQIRAVKRLLDQLSHPV